MPIRAARPCTYPGCDTLTFGGRCEQHRNAEKRELDRRRGDGRSRGYDARWKRARDLFLAEHPLCAHHMRRGELVPAQTVDHIVPHRGDDRLFWDRGNWQSLCFRCHSVKTATTDGAFGNPVHRGARPGRGGSKV